MAPMLKKEMAQIDWENQTVSQIHNLVRGLNPIMGVYTFLEGKKIKFWKVKALKNEEFLQAYEEMKEYAYKLSDIMEGTVLLAEEKHGLYIKAKEGILQVLEIQGENAKRMQVSDFLRGTRIMAGTVLENVH